MIQLPNVRYACMSTSGLRLVKHYSGVLDAENSTDAAYF